MDLRLDVTTLPFGSVAAYSKVKRNVCIINDGDIGARCVGGGQGLGREGKEGRQSGRRR